MKTIENAICYKKHSYKKITKFILFVCLLLIVNNIFKLALVDPCNYQLPIRDFYKTDGYDTIFLGTCHSYGSIDPLFLDDRLGISAYNLGTADQSLDTSFFLLKEAVKHNDIKTVYLEMYYSIWLMDPESYKDRQIGRVSDLWGVMDVVPFSVDKMRYMFSATNKDYYFMSLFPVCRERRDIFNFDQLQKNMEQNVKIISQDYSQKRGFRVHKGEMNISPVIYSDVCTTEMIKGDNLRYLEKIISFCRNKDIELILYTAPMWEGLLMEVDYDKYVEAVTELCRKNDLAYYDFNLVSPEYMRMDQSSYFDYTRLNEVGSEKFMEVFSDYLNGKYPDDFFLSTYQEKMKLLEEGVYGICYHRITDETGEEKGVREYEIRAITNVLEKERIRYSIQITEDNGEQKTVLAPAESGYSLVVPLDEEGEPIAGTISIQIYLDDKEVFCYEGEL